MTNVRKTKFEIGYERKYGLMKKIFNRASEESPGHRYRIITPPGLGQWETRRAGKNNPDARSSGDMGFTFGLQCNTIKGRTVADHVCEVGYWVENKMGNIIKLQQKIPTFNNRPVDKDAVLAFNRGKMGVLGFGTEHAKKVLWFAFVNLDDLRPHEIELTLPNADPRQVHVRLERLLATGPMSGWQPLEIKPMGFAYPAFTDYVLKRVLWVREEILRNKP